MKSSSILAASVFVTELAGCSGASQEQASRPSAPIQSSEYDCEESIKTFAPLIRARLSDAGMVEMVDEAGRYLVSGPYREGTPHGYWFPDATIPSLAQDISSLVQVSCEGVLASSGTWNDEKTKKTIDIRIKMEIAKACKKDESMSTSPQER